MSISIIFIHVNNSSFILICNEKTGIFFWYKLQSSIVIQDSIPTILDKCKS